MAYGRSFDARGESTVGAARAGYPGARWNGGSQARSLVSDVPKDLLEPSSAEVTINYRLES
jgi:hypothetical protein